VVELLLGHTDGDVLENGIRGDALRVEVHRVAERDRARKRDLEADVRMTGRPVGWFAARQTVLTVPSWRVTNADCLSAEVASVCEAAAWAARSDSSTPEPLPEQP
jgi:hypothetical protein